MKVFVGILTTHTIELCRLTYESTIIQKGFEFDIFIIVNTLNTTYIDQVYKEFLGLNVKIIQTESNGKPGKGHNSVLNTFLQKTEYEYCILIDSGDLFYNEAFLRISKYMKYNPDILFIAYHDNLTDYIDNSCIYIDINKKCLLNLCFIELLTKEWYSFKGRNPFMNDVNNLNTPARPLFFSRKAINSNIYYDENMRLYDDYIVFIKAFENTLLRKINGFILIDADIYVYNRIDTKSVSNNYFSGNYNEEENNNFQMSINNEYLLVRDWNLTLFPKLSLGQMNQEGYLLFKSNYLSKMISKLHLPESLSFGNNIDKAIEQSKNNKLLKEQYELQLYLDYKNKN